MSRKRGAEFVIIKGIRGEGIGGWIDQLGPVDTDKIDQARAGAIEASVKAADFFSVPDHLPGQSHPEMMAWKIDVEAGEQQHSVSWIDTSQDSRIEGLQKILEEAEAAGFDWTRVHQ
jgi:hypothetical protein